MAKYIDKQAALALLGVKEDALKKICKDYGVEVRAGFALAYNYEHLHRVKNARSYGGNKNAVKEGNEAEARAIMEQKEREKAQLVELRKRSKEEAKKAAAAALINKKEHIKKGLKEARLYEGVDELAISALVDVELLAATLLKEVASNGVDEYTEKGTSVMRPAAQLLPKLLKIRLESYKGLGIGAGNRKLSPKEEEFIDDGLAKFLS